MKNKLVVIPTIHDPIQLAPGFAKKKLATYKLDIMGLCGFGCRYCSTNAGNTLRIHREEYADHTEAQLGVRTYPADDPALTFVWKDVVENLVAQLDRKRAGKAWGAGETLVFSMLTDAFSPHAVASGLTREVLELVLARTSFRIRVLTKSSVVGKSEWTSFFASHPGRFVVGLSTGTLDEAWARKVEIGTSSPYARLMALGALRDAGVPTYGMLCPVFPDMLNRGELDLDALIDDIRPDLVEHVWAETYNDRLNWREVRAGYSPDSRGYAWFTRVYESGEPEEWSEYATELYVRLRDRAKRDGWLHKLRYLLYEDGITEHCAPTFRGLEGVLLQSKPRPDGKSANPYIAAVQ